MKLTETDWDRLVLIPEVSLASLVGKAYVQKGLWAVIDRDPGPGPGYGRDLCFFPGPGKIIFKIPAPAPNHGPGCFCQFLSISAGISRIFCLNLNR